MSSTTALLQGEYHFWKIFLPSQRCFLGSVKAQPAKHVEELQACDATFEQLVAEMHACQADM